ncbi:uncharacterized protein LOC106178734 [Lingula anatina]|uniref:Uncharacterized protein LOC106178734 n=1 Tax=Lingula anatina TaxID=7574 RepID=A0A1S3K4Z0_LINAN|nr:uncharacterized protein LOC106178734 [Lingula anatina]|eukprot:XP_013417489.1 uncharacterized protein LOC106178734 [Lingula anatina]
MEKRIQCFTIVTLFTVLMSPVTPEDCTNQAAAPCLRPFADYLKIIKQLIPKITRQDRNMCINYQTARQCLETVKKHCKSDVPQQRRTKASLDSFEDRLDFICSESRQKALQRLEPCFSDPAKVSAADECEFKYNATNHVIVDTVVSRQRTLRAICYNTQNLSSCITNVYKPCGDAATDLITALLRQNFKRLLSGSTCEIKSKRQQTLTTERSTESKVQVGDSSSSSVILCSQRNSFLVVVALLVGLIFYECV